MEKGIQTDYYNLTMLVIYKVCELKLCRHEYITKYQINEGIVSPSRRFPH